LETESAFTAGVDWLLQDALLEPAAAGKIQFALR